VVTVRFCIVLAVATACGGPSYDALRARAIGVGQSREQVRAAMGQPHHMAKTLEHPKACVERWLYGDPTQDVFLVDFDDQGRVCDVAFAHGQ